MARIRTIKPEFFTSLTIADLPLTARLTFIGLWTHVDDDGRAVDESRLVRAAVWPLDDRTAADVEADLRALHDASLIRRYEHAGRRYLAVTGWREHQRIDKPKSSKFPSPDDGTPRPKPSNPGDAQPGVTCADEEFPDGSATDPGTVPDGSATDPGTVPVGREQGTGKGTGNREGERAPASESGNLPAARPSPPERPDGRPAPIDDDGFKVTDSMRRWATSTFGAAVDIEYETAQFLDHYRANGSRRSSWPAAWQKWIRQAAKWKSERAFKQQPAANVVDIHARQNSAGVDPVTANLMAGLALLEERDNA